jgi:hypothetical protein
MHKYQESNDIFHNQCIYLLCLCVNHHVGKSESLPNIQTSNMTALCIRPFQEEDDIRLHLQDSEHLSRATLAGDIGSDSETGGNVSKP